VFALCAVADFVLRYIDKRSVPAGVISIVDGLFGTAFYLAVLKWFWTANHHAKRSPIHLQNHSGLVWVSCFNASARDRSPMAPASLPT
jgi:hypothetical protein